jgi:hypothetical protein
MNIMHHRGAGAAHVIGNKIIKFGVPLLAKRQNVNQRAKEALTHFWWNWRAVWRHPRMRIDVMPQAFRASVLVPRGFVVEAAKFRA